MTTLTPERPSLDTSNTSPVGAHRRTTYPLLAACRPRQWVKNLLVYAVAFASGRLFEPRTFLLATAAAAVFTAASSATYLINDAGDAEADQRHPTKRLRPIAAGDLGIRQAYTAAVTLLVASIIGAAALGSVTVALVVTYLVITTTYSRWLKHLALIDAIAVATGFVLRTAVGGTATAITITPIFLTVSAAGAMFIVIGKRLGEVIELGPENAPSHRKVLAWYTPNDATASSVVRSQRPSSPSPPGRWELPSPQDHRPSHPGRSRSPRCRSSLSPSLPHAPGR